MSTISALSVVNNISMQRVGVRWMGVYEPPAELKPDQGKLTTSNGTVHWYQDDYDWNFYWDRDTMDLNKRQAWNKKA